MSRKWWIVAAFVAIPISSRAQSSADSATYRRAQSMVNDGNPVAGRAIVDSRIARTTPGTNAYAEGLYWRAVLSATAADAEMDYRRIIVDHPLSPRVEDVLLRLAQLELARADYDGALLAGCRAPRVPRAGSSILPAPRVRAQDTGQRESCLKRTTFHAHVWQTQMHSREQARTTPSYEIRSLISI